MSQPPVDENFQQRQSDHSAVTIDRIAAILHDEGLEHVVEAIEIPGGQEGAPAHQEIARTGFVNQSIIFAVQDDYLVSTSLWRGHASTEFAARALAMSNEWNLNQILPGAHFYENAQGEIEFAARRALRCRDGLSTNQLGAFVVSTIDAFVGIWNHYEVSWPELKDWEDTTND